MSSHRGFYFMMALVPVGLAGILYASVLSVEDTMHKSHVKAVLERAAVCHPPITAGAEELPQQQPQDEPEACVDGPNSVFHPQDDFDDLVDRDLPDPEPKALDINVRAHH
jgi:hypothetical protein